VGSTRLVYRARQPRYPTYAHVVYAARRMAAQVYYAKALFIVEIHQIKKGIDFTPIASDLLFALQECCPSFA
jgi:hypothetical protein